MRRQTGPEVPPPKPSVSESFVNASTASIAVETWAGAQFWDELAFGRTPFNEHTHLQPPLAFFTWRARVEGERAQRTREALQALHLGQERDEDHVIHIERELLVTA